MYHPLAPPPTDMTDTLKTACNRHDSRHRQGQRLKVKGQDVQFSTGHYRRDKHF